MNKHQELLDLAKISYSDSVMEVIKSLHGQGYWRVLLSFGSYEDDWDSIFFTPSKIALKFLNCTKSSYYELVEALGHQLVSLPDGVSRQVYDAVHEMFDDRTVCS